MDPKIIFEDSDLLILEKPPGLVVDKSETQRFGTLENWLEETYHLDVTRSGIVHRLDKDTSGLILVAKNSKSLENLQAQFAGKEVQKEYLTLVHGKISEPGVVEGSIGRNPGNREKFTVLEDGGKEASTEYSPIENFQIKPEQLETIFDDLNKIQARKLGKLYSDGFTLVRCFPKTGRTHQIRVHLKYINHPVVSDAKYVGRKVFRLDSRWCERLFLHAAKITFKHPSSGQPMEFESSLPDDLKKALWTAFSYNLP